MITIEQLLKFFDAGIMTRSELVSALAERPLVPLEDEQLARDVDELRAKIASDDTFEIKSAC